MRAAVVGGVAYHAGKRVQGGRDSEAEQDARIDDLEQQGGSAQPGGVTDATLDQLKQLGELKAQGVLTQEEFDTQKQRLLQAT
jgi:hypothetical protein